MLITDKFVVLNMPKTGSTFVRTVIKDIYRQRAERGGRDEFAELILPNINAPKVPHNQHGAYCQIPPAARNKTVVTVTRNPYERFLSHYEFRWWAKLHSLSRETLDRHFPHFPNLNLDEYVAFLELSDQNALPNNPWKIGNQTIRFIRMYFENPAVTLQSLSPDYFKDTSRFMRELEGIVFLRNENLNEELAAFLARMGFSQAEVEFCRSHQRVNVTERPKVERSQVWTPRALNYVEHHERFLFQMLSAVGITYKKPA